MIFQQLIFRPTVGLGGPRTVVNGLFPAAPPSTQAAASTVPPAGSAARAALRDNTSLGALTRHPKSALLARLYR